MQFTTTCYFPLTNNMISVPCANLLTQIYFQFLGSEK